MKVVRREAIVPSLRLLFPQAYIGVGELDMGLNLVSPSFALKSRI